MPGYQAIIFDMDGLMVDTERLYFACNHEIAARYGKSVGHDVLRQMMGRAPLESIGLFCEALQISQSPAAILAEREELMVARLRGGFTAMPGLRELIEHVNGRYRLAIATGSPQRFLDIIVDQLKLRDHFEVLQTSDGIRQGKPHPEIYLRAMARLGVRGEHCIVLEDSPNGVKAGRAAGAYVIAVPNEHTQDGDLSAAHVRVRDLHAARQHLMALEVG